MKILKFLIFLLILLFPLGELSKLPFFTSAEIHICLQDLILAFLVIFWLLYHFSKKKPFSKPPLLKPIFLFLALAFLSLLVNALRLSINELTISSLYLLRWSTFSMLYFIIYEITKEEAFQKPIILQLLISAGVLSAVFGLFQYFLYPNLRNLNYLHWDPHENRVFGTFFDPGFLGIILVLTLILLTISLLNKPSFLKLPCPAAKFFALSVWFITYSALILTYSRSSYLAYLAAMSILSFLKKSWKFFLFIAVVFSVSLILLPHPSGEGAKLKRTSTVNARVKNYQETLAIIKKRPLFGVGFNALRYAKRDYGFLGEKTWRVNHAAAGSDSSLLFVWATTGVFGLLAYLWFLWRIWQITNYQLRITNYQSVAHLATLSTLMALLTHSLFLNSLFYPWVMLWFWLILGISHAALNNRLVSRCISGHNLK